MYYGLRRKAAAVPSSLSGNHTVSINPSLLEILCCPAVHDGKACHGHLVYLGDSLKCESCGLIYPIEDGIPVLLIDHAKKGDLPLSDHQAAAEQNNNGENK